MIDLHVDTPSELFYQRKELLENNLAVDIQKLQKGNSTAQFFAMYIDRKKTETPFKLTNQMIDYFLNEISKNSETISLCNTFEDISSDKIGAFLTIEEGSAIEGNIDNISHFKNRGVSLMTLLWNYENELGFPNIKKDFMNEGLKRKGFEAIEEMNKLKMIIDVSHLSDGGFIDVINNSSSPIVASHSNSREITNHSRNLTDSMIKRLADNGGIMGINFANSFIRTKSIFKQNNTTKIKDIIKHIKHIRKVGGVDIISLGSDFDGITNPVEIKDIGEMPKLREKLLKSKFTENEVDKIFFKNAERIIKDVL